MIFCDRIPRVPRRGRDRELQVYHPGQVNRRRGGRIGIAGRCAEIAGQCKFNNR